MSSADKSRRHFIKKTAYVAPAIFTLKALPAVARNGSHGNNGVGNGLDPQPKGNPPPNDLLGTARGLPGNRN